MSQDNAEMGSSENVVVSSTSSSSGGSSFSSEKRTIPLLYMPQSRAKTNGNVGSGSESNNSASSSTPSPYNGVTGKLVQVQGQNQFTYIGTLLKPSIVRKDQKVLLAPLSDSGGTQMTRLILPKTSGQNLMKVVLPQSPGKPMCRNYLLQATVQNSSLKTTQLIGKGPVFFDSSLGPSAKIISQNIVRQIAPENKTNFIPVIPTLKSLSTNVPSPNSNLNKVIESEVSNEVVLSISDSTDSEVEKEKDLIFSETQVKESDPLVVQPNVSMAEISKKFGASTGEIITIEDDIVDTQKLEDPFTSCFSPHSAIESSIKDEVEKVTIDLKNADDVTIEKTIKEGECLGKVLKDKLEETSRTENNRNLMERKVSSTTIDVDNCPPPKAKKELQISEEKKDSLKSNLIVQESPQNNMLEVNETNISDVMDVDINVGKLVPTSMDTRISIRPVVSIIDSESVESNFGNDNVDTDKIGLKEETSAKSCNSMKLKDSHLPESLPISLSSGITSSTENNIESDSLEIKAIVDETKESGSKVESNSNMDISVEKIPGLTIARARKRKGKLLNESPKPNFPWQVEMNKVLPGAEEYDPFQVIEWDPNGLGILPGSDIKFVLNEFGLLEVFQERRMKKTIKGDASDSGVKEADPDEIFCCLSCKCYGLISEFYNENFCSKACKDSPIGQQSLMKKRLLEEENVTEMRKKQKVLQITEAINPKLSPVKDALMPKEKGSKTLTEEADSEENNEVISLDDDECIESDESASEKKSNNGGTTSPKIKKGAIKQDKNDEDYQPPKTYSRNVKTSVRETFQLRQREIKSNEERPRKEGEAEPDDENPKKLDLKRRSSSDCSLQKALLKDKKVSELPVKDKKFPDFPWTLYLTQTLSKPAWVKLFNNPYPTSPNNFRVGYKLEAIDPEHQSNFCAVTVAEVKGFRIKLHFDGYSRAYDFWVNADSPNIFPCGFCSRKSIPLQPPWGYNAEAFSWQSYLSSWKARSAPLNSFLNYRQVNTSPNLFRTGMRLEAVDKKNSTLICVASVAAVLGNRILVHFDSWGDVYDYWAETSSPYIHYVGWCRENKHVLTPPNGMRPSEFKWSSYLKEKSAIAAPRRAFNLRPHLEFKKGTKIEAVDKRAAHLLRVATIEDDLPYQIRISFDGFPKHFGYWVDDDSPDIHPVGWGNKSVHPVEPPPMEDTPSICPTPGCIGQGHAMGLKSENHTTEEDCPYSLDNLHREDILPDRLSDKPNIFNNLGVTSSASQLSTRPCEEKQSCKKKKSKSDDIDLVEEGERNEVAESDDEDMKSKRWKWLSVKEKSNSKNQTHRVTQSENKETKMDIEDDEEEDTTIKNDEKLISNENEVEEPIKENVESLKIPARVAYEDLSEIVKDLKGQDWSPSEVADFVKRVLNKHIYLFVEEEIDGEAFLMLSKGELVEYLGFKVGEASKLFNAIVLLRDNVT